MNFPDTPCTPRQIYEFVPPQPIRMKAGKQHSIQFSSQNGDSVYVYTPATEIDPILYSGTEPGYDKRVYFHMDLEEVELDLILEEIMFMINSIGISQKLSHQFKQFRF